MKSLIDFIQNWRVELGIFLVSLSLYITTASRSVTLGDTGEFLTAASIGGVVHDPAYPLYSLITRLIFLAPFGQSAFALNISSCFFAAVTLALTYRMSKMLTKSIPASLFAALSLGTYEFFWFYALVVQVHIFHVFLLSVFLYFLLLAFQSKQIKYLYAAGFAFGLGANHSQTIIFVVPSMLYVMFLLRKKISLFFMVKLLLVSLTGFASYIYTFWAAQQNPVMNWGGIHDIQTLLFVLFRGNYGTLNLTAHKVSAPFEYSSIVFYFQSLVSTSWYVLLPAVVSLQYFNQKDHVYRILFIAFMLMGPFFYVLMDQRMITVTHWALVEQYIPYSFLFISIFAAMGFTFISQKIQGISQKALIIGVILFFVVPILVTFQKVRLDNNHLLDHTTRLIFSELPKNSVVITTGDTLYFPGMYLQNLEKVRPDIVLIQLGQLKEWYEKQLILHHPELKEYLRNTQFDFGKACAQLAPLGKLYISPWYIDFEGAFSGKCENVPHGMITKVVPIDAVPKIEDVKKYNDNEVAKFLSIVKPEQYKTHSSRTRQMLFDIAEQINARGLYYQKKGKIDWAVKDYRLATKISPDETFSLTNEAAIYFYKEDYLTAIKLLEEGAKRSQLSEKLHYALGFSYGKAGDEEKAYYAFKKYLSFEPKGDPQIPAIRQFIADFENRTQ